MRKALLCKISGKLQGSFREASGKLQGSFREASGKLQGRFREASGKLPVSFLENPGKHGREGEALDPTHPFFRIPAENNHI